MPSFHICDYPGCGNPADEFHAYDCMSRCGKDYQVCNEHRNVEPKKAFWSNKKDWRKVRRPNHD